MRINMWIHLSFYVMIYIFGILGLYDFMQLFVPGGGVVKELIIISMIINAVVLIVLLFFPFFEIRNFSGDFVKSSVFVHCYILGAFHVYTMYGNGKELIIFLVSIPSGMFLVKVMRNSKLKSRKV